MDWNDWIDADTENENVYFGIVGRFEEQAARAASFAEIARRFSPDTVIIRIDYTDRWQPAIAVVGNEWIAPESVQAVFSDEFAGRIEDFDPARGIFVRR